MGIVVGNSFWFDFEVAFMEWLQRILGETGVKIVSQFSLLGEELIIVLIIGFLYWCYDKKMGEAVGTSVMLGLVFAPMIKNVFWRRRPYFDHESIKCYRPVAKDADIYDIAAQGFSFPSNHCTNAVSVYSTVAAKAEKKRKLFNVIAIVAPILVGISRICVGVHYPTDVICGIVLGVICVIVSVTISNKVPDEKRWIPYLIIFGLACIGLIYCKTSDYFAALGMISGIFVAFEFERRFVKFEGTREPLKCVIRIFFGLVVYVCLNTVLKLPFSKEFLSSGTFLAGIVRCIRYFIVIFGIVGVYPMSFKFMDKRK